MSSFEAQRPGGLTGRIAVVTGASSGVGRAIALALSREGARVTAVGRSADGLAETVSAAHEDGPITAAQADLTSEEDLQTLLRHLLQWDGVDILIHCAGAFRQANMEQAPVDDLDLQYATNVRAPYRLTQVLLPQLIAARGQVVFINSSVGLSAKRAGVGQYAASKHALKAIADSLREEVNPQGVRVLSVYLGRTATPMQEAVHRIEGKAYNRASLLQPEDVASTVICLLALAPSAEVTDISIRPMRTP
ncbi:MAG: SDR family NAD(P)-dependent oxidoreductase [Acidobacteriaceae bacterium]